MPDELLFWLTEQPDEVLLKLLAWSKSKSFDELGEELHNTISRQAPAKEKVKTKTMKQE